MWLFVYRINSPNTEAFGLYDFMLFGDGAFFFGTPGTILTRIPQVQNVPEIKMRERD